MYSLLRFSSISLLTATRNTHRKCIFTADEMFKPELSSSLQFLTRATTGAAAYFRRVLFNDTRRRIVESFDRREGQRWWLHPERKPENDSTGSFEGK